MGNNCNLWEDDNELWGNKATLGELWQPFGKSNELWANYGIIWQPAGKL